MRTYVKAAQCSVILLCLGGCGGSGKGYVPVEGNVTLDGAPMSGVYVFFDQPEAARNNSYAGLTDEQGHFELRGLGEGSSGAPPGSYRVILSTAVVKPGSPEGTPTPPERVPSKYAGGKLKYDVPEAGEKDVRFELKNRG
jgi:hypothetical protein